MSLLTNNLGYPRKGPRRELKKALESLWSDKGTETELLQTATELRTVNWVMQQSVGIDLIPSNDFSLYDHVLDMAALVDAVPDCYEWSDSRLMITVNSYDR